MRGILILVIYTILMLTVTFILAGKKKNSESFYVGNRKMGTLSSAMSIAATWIWAPALFVSAEQAYTNGFIGLFWFLVPNVICLLIFIPFAKMIRKQLPNGITLSGYMFNMYKSKKVKGVYLFQLSVLTILSTGVQLLAGGTILSGITGLPFFIVTIILALIAFSYSQISGIRASVITDSIQMILILAACAVFVPWALNMNGVNSVINGLGGISKETVSLFSERGLEIFLSFGLPTAIGLISGPFGDQCFWQRAFSIRECKIGKAFLLGGILFAAVPALMGILGFIAAGIDFIPSDKSVVNLELISGLFPNWVMIIFLFMLISGLLSTVDSNLCAISSLTTDICGTDKLRLSKISMIVLLIVGIAIASIPDLTVTELFLFYGTLRASTLLPTVMTLKNKKLTSKGIVIGIMVSLCLGLPIFTFGTVMNISLYKTLGSVITVALSGLTALIIKFWEDRHNAWKKTKY